MIVKPQTSKKQTSPAEKQVKRQTFVNLARKIKSSTVTTINTADLIQILQPAIRSEFRKCLFPGAQTNSKNDPMEEVNHAESEETCASATIQCKIRNITFTNAGIDSGASNSIMSSEILSQLGLNITSKFGNEGKLSGIATSVDLIGWVNNVPVKVGDLIITDNFLVVEDSSPILILGNTWLRRAKGCIDYDKSEVKFKKEDKEISVPVSFHTKLKDGKVIEVEANKAQLIIQETKKNK